MDREDYLQAAAAIALPLVKKWEGFRKTAYLCPAKVWTIGYGHTHGVSQGDTITKRKAEKLLEKELMRRMEEVLSVLLTTPDPNELAAMVSLQYNIGQHAFAQSSVVRNWNNGNIWMSGESFKLWNKATINGKLTVLPGLVNRRADEVRVFRGESL